MRIVTVCCNYLFTRSTQYMKLRNSWSVSRRPRMWSLDFSTSTTFPSMSRLRGNINPALIKSIFILSVVTSKSQLRNWFFSSWIKLSIFMLCRFDLKRKIPTITLSMKWTNIDSSSIACATDHLHQTFYAICMCPIAYQTLPYDPNHVVLEIFATKYLLISLAQCPSDENHLSV